ncbi:hypothetical protein D3C79_731480 [compost metagenome]
MKIVNEYNMHTGGGYMVYCYDVETNDGSGLRMIGISEVVCGYSVRFTDEHEEVGPDVDNELWIYDPSSTAELIELLTILPKDIGELVANQWLKLLSNDDNCVLQFVSNK